MKHLCIARPVRSRPVFPRLLAMAAAVAAFSPAGAAPTLHEVLITADLRDSSELRVPASVSVLDSEAISRRAAQHVEDLLNVTPNVNFSAGSSRARFVQIRGVGERSQFVDPVNPSVGMVIDGIDFSGIGGAGLLHDIGQVEVLRGPQGTRFGANGMAGLLVLVSERPTDEFEGSITTEYANYDSWRVAGMLNGPLADNLNARVSVSQYQSDGFQRNDFLGRDDTADFDEFSARARFDWQVTDALNLDLTVIHIDVDNGYDAFSLDNTRTTLSDNPGGDQQRTTAFSLKGTWETEPVTLETTVTWEDTATHYFFDEDWAHPGLCDGTLCAPGDTYESIDDYHRDRDSYSLDLRVLSNESSRLFDSTDWLAGVYVYRKDETMERDYTYDPLFVTDWDVDRIALYAQTDTDLTDALRLSVGVRWEHFEGDYRDNRGVDHSTDEDLWGGQVSLEYHLNDQQMVYGLVSRGYKPGGVNGVMASSLADPGLEPSVREFLMGNRTFDTETLMNYEVGFKGSLADERIRVRAAAFYMDRKDIQVKNWYNRGTFFTEFLDNATRGDNAGIELETEWLATERLTLFASLGWLETRTGSILVRDVETREIMPRGSRDQGHAPNYQFHAGFQYDWDQWFFRLEVEGKDRFYFSDGHNAQSWSYELFNAQLGYRQGPLQLTLWGRNLTDEDYPTRGFYFGNDPRKGYTTEPFYQYGEPRRVGVAATYRF